LKCHPTGLPATAARVSAEIDPVPPRYQRDRQPPGRSATRLLTPEDLPFVHSDRGSALPLSAGNPSSRPDRPLHSFTTADPTYNPLRSDSASLLNSLPVSPSCAPASWFASLTCRRSLGPPILLLVLLPFPDHSLDALDVERGWSGIRGFIARGSRASFFPAQRAERATGTVAGMVAGPSRPVRQLFRQPDPGLPDRSATPAQR